MLIWCFCQVNPYLFSWLGYFITFDLCPYEVWEASYTMPCPNNLTVTRYPGWSHFRLPRTHHFVQLEILLNSSPDCIFVTSVTSIGPPQPIFLLKGIIVPWSSFRTILFQATTGSKSSLSFTRHSRGTSKSPRAFSSSPHQQRYTVQEHTCSVTTLEGFSDVLGWNPLPVWQH